MVTKTTKGKFISRENDKKNEEDFLVSNETLFLLKNKNNEFHLNICLQERRDGKTSTFDLSDL